ncbi:MAG: hypothetical protein AAGH99_04040 [Planctomycetota bacterium]
MGVFWSQVAQEWRMQRRRPFVWFCLIAYFLLAIGDTVQAGWSASGGSWINGADAIATRSIIYSILGILVAAGVVGEPMARDRAYRAAGVVLTTGAGRWPLATGRFVVALVLVLISALMFLPGVWLGTKAPGILPEYVGPWMGGLYAWSAVTFILPNFFLVSALTFAVASWRQSQAAAYAAAVGFVAVWVTVRMLLGQDVLRHDVFARYALLDPFGSIASAEFIMGRTVAENNTQFPPLAGLLLINRLIWLGVAVALTVVGVIAFPMRERQSSGGTKGRGWLRLLPSKLRLSRLVPELPGQVFRIAAWELRAIGRAPGAKLVLVFVAFSLWWAAASAVTHRFSLPSTDLLVHNTGFYFDKILILAVVWVAGDLIWREKQYAVDGLIDAQPTRETHRYLAKLLALVIVVLVFWAVSIAVNVTYQAAHGYTDFEFDLHLVDSFVFKAPYYLFFAVLALTMQIIVRQRYVAMGLVLLVYLSETLMDALGWYHPMWRYGRMSFFWYSLMDGYGHFWEAHLWLLLYWSFGASFVGLLGWATLDRGPEPQSRWALVRQRLGRGPGRSLGMIVLLVFVAVGANVWFQSTVRATWPPIDADALKAEVEKTYGPEWRGVRQPRIVEVTAELDLYPEERRFELRGQYALHNPHDTPIDRVLVLAEAGLTIDDVSLPGGQVEMIDPALNASIYRLEAPLAPGQETTMDFVTSWSAPAGFAVHAESDGIPTVGPTEVIGNGTSLLNLQIMPAVGYTDRVEHKPKWKRRKYGLPPEWQAPAGEDALRQSHATFHLDWVRRVEMTIRTAADQTAYHPGTLADEWTEPDGRRGFRYVIDRPSRGWATIVSGRLVESRYQRDGLPDVVLAHDPDHTHTLDAFAGALHDAIAHFQKRYGPPPFDTFYMVEQSLHFDGMGTRSGFGFASEVLGWKTDLKASGGEDLHAMAAHLMGMTWWGDQIIPANVAGAKVVHAGLPFWTAQLYLHQRRSPDVDLRLRRQALAEAFRGRSTLIDEEAPYSEEFKDSTMIRAKGSGQMLYLASLMGGPATLEAVLAEFLGEWRYREAPYPTARDLTDHLAEAVREDLHPQLSNIFDRVLTWDLSIRDASAKKRPDGRWTASVRVTAAQFETTGWGESEPTPLNAPVDLVVYGPMKDGNENVLLRQTIDRDHADEILRWEFSERPVSVAIDPHLFLPDPDPYNNTTRFR